NESSSDPLSHLMGNECPIKSMTMVKSGVSESLDECLSDTMNHQVKRQEKIKKVSEEVSSDNGLGDDPTSLPMGHPVTHW
ncbi:hypothetical protein HAX54_018085, partial [Datura stramonium]|nr:hypothetical protein [Datura stramonium]